MTTNAPEPLTPAESDLQDFPFMPLHVARLRDSDLAAEEDPESCWYAVLLWASAWHQLPAGSLPDNDTILMRLVGLGRDTKTWKRRRDGALRGFVTCSDGRLYHPVIAEQVNSAWAEKIAYRKRRDARKTSGEAGARAKWGTEPDCPDDHTAAPRTRSQRLAAARERGTHTAEEWQALLDHCDNRCVRCGDAEKIVKDHVAPIYQGGSDGIDNLQPLCPRCNSSKGSERIDHRPDGWQRLAKRLPERLANDGKTPGNQPMERLPKGTGTGTGTGTVSQAKPSQESKPEPSRTRERDGPLRAADCLNEICTAARWHPRTDDARIEALSVVDGWLAEGFNLDLVLAGIGRALAKKPGKTSSLKRFTTTIRGIHSDHGGQRFNGTTAPMHEPDIAAGIRDLTHSLAARMAADG